MVWPQVLKPEATPLSNDIKVAGLFPETCKQEVGLGANWNIRRISYDLPFRPRTIYDKQEDTLHTS